jgi:hypothetical protein
MHACHAPVQLLDLQQKAASSLMKKRQIYKPRLLGDQIVTPADLRRIHKELLEFERIDAVSDEMRALIESEWPGLVHRLPPAKPQG